MKPVITKIFWAALLAAALALPGAPARAAPEVYVPLGNAGKVVIIDAARDAIIGTIPDLPNVHGLAGAPGGAYLVAGRYLKSKHGKKSKNGKSALPPKPAGMSEADHQTHHSMKTAASPAKAKAVSFVSIVRVADGSILRRIEVKGAVHHTAETPDGRYALATQPVAGTVSVLDLSTFGVVAVVKTGLGPNYVVVSPDGKRAYVSNGGDGTVSEIDTGTWTLSRTLPAGTGAGHMVLSSDGKTLYVANVKAGTVSDISLKSGAVRRTFDIGGRLHGLDLSEDGRTLFVSARAHNKLVAVDLANGKMRSAPVGPSPYHLTVIPGTGKIYVSSGKKPLIRVVDQGSLKVLDTISLPGTGHQMVVVRQ